LVSEKEFERLLDDSGNAPLFYIFDMEISTISDYGLNNQKLINKEILKKIIKKSNFNGVAKDGNTFLMAALQSKCCFDKEIWKILIEKSDCSKKGLNGNTPLIFALLTPKRGWDLDLWKLLIDRSNISERNRTGLTPLMAVFFNSEIPDEVIQTILDYSKIEAKDNNMNNALTYAIKYGAKNVNPKFIDQIFNNANFNIKDGLGEFPLLIALEHMPKLSKKNWDKLYQTYDFLDLRDKQKLAFRLAEYIFIGRSNLFVVEQNFKILKDLPKDVPLKIRDFINDYIRKEMIIIEHKELSSKITSGENDLIIKKQLKI
jgi:ankyrin repeat protein